VGADPRCAAWAAEIIAAAQRLWTPAVDLEVTLEANPTDAEAARFFRALEALDAYLASEAPISVPCERLFQGAIADALTHTGQLAMLRRLAGAPVKGENYSRAHIAAGRVGPDQPEPVREFD